MKHMLKKDLPFLNKGAIFTKTHSAGPGWAVEVCAPDRSVHQNLTSSDGLYQTFNDAENEILTTLMGKADWIESIPECMVDLFFLYDAGLIDREQFKLYVEFKP